MIRIKPRDEQRWEGAAVALNVFSFVEYGGSRRRGSDGQRAGKFLASIIINFVGTYSIIVGKGGFWRRIYKFRPLVEVSEALKFLSHTQKPPSPFKLLLRQDGIPPRAASSKFVFSSFSVLRAPVPAGPSAP